MLPGTTSAFAERIIGGYYLNIESDRAQLARYGLMITDVQDVIVTAFGAEAMTNTVEGRERYTVSMRYPRDQRSDPHSIATQVLITETLIVMLSVPFALVGGLWLMWWLGSTYRSPWSRCRTGVVMLICLDSAYKQLQAERERERRPFMQDDLYAAIMDDAVECVRPKMMTVVAIMAGLLPIMWSHGAVAEIMQRIAVPMIGGMVSSTLLTLLVIPSIYAVMKCVTIRSPRLAAAVQPPPKGCACGARDEAETVARA